MRVKSGERRDDTSSAPLGHLPLKGKAVWKGRGGKLGRIVWWGLTIGGKDTIVAVQEKREKCSV